MITAWEVPIDYVFDPVYVNFPPSAEYLAWRLSTNPGKGTALWTIQVISSTPTVTLDDLLPDDAVLVEVTAELYTYGYIRHMDPPTSISDLESKIDTFVSDSFS